MKSNHTRMAAAAASLILAGSGMDVPAAEPDEASKIKITRVGSNPGREAPAEYFSGSGRIDPLFQTEGDENKSAAFVTFQPGARTAWHTHPLGQILVITAGAGLVQQWGDPIQEIKTGDVVWIPPGQKHWHGAAPETSVTHIAIQDAVKGQNAGWMEKVTDGQYPMKTETKDQSKAVQAAPVQPNIGARRLSPEDVRSVAPALEKYTAERLHGEVWKRPGLSARDRSLVTMAALITRKLDAAMPYYFNLALDSGVKPGELSETITHLAFYSGWGNAFAAIQPAQEAFAKHGIGPDQLPAEPAALLPLDVEAEQKRATIVGGQFGETAPGVVEYTTDILFNDLWLRPGLSPRDRSLITVSALISAGQVAQIPYHLNRAMDNGLTKEQAGEVITHLAFYAGWPCAFSALPVAKEVFAARTK